MEKYGFVYLWYDRKRKMYYIGCHWGSIDDGYICSSDRMRKAYRRRSKDFKRRILESNISTREQTLNIEHQWFSLIREEELGNKYYNLRKHKWGHWTTDEDSKLTVGEKISKSRIGKKYSKRGPRSEEVKQKISKSLKGKSRSEEHIKKSIEGRLGYKHSKETKLKISQSNKGKQRGIRIMTDEIKQKISISNKGKKFTKEHKEKLRDAQSKIIRKKRGPYKKNKNDIDHKFNLQMAEDVWLKVKGYPIPDSYSEKDRLEIFDRYYHRAVSQSQGE